MKPPRVTGIELIFSFAITKPWMKPTRSPAATAIAAPSAGELPPVFTASMPPSR